MHPVCISRKYSWSMIRELNSVSQPHLLAGLCAGVAVNKKAPFLLQYSDPAQSLDGYKTYLFRYDCYP